MSDDNSSQVQVARIAIKYRQLDGWILRMFRTREKENTMFLWKTFVFSVLEYCSPAMVTESVKLIAEHETIMWSFTSKINQLITIAQLLGRTESDKLQLPRRKGRHDRLLVIYIPKIREGIVQNFIIESYTNTRNATMPTTVVFSLTSSCRETLVNLNQGKSCEREHRHLTLSFTRCHILEEVLNNNTSKTVLLLPDHSFELKFRAGKTLIFYFIKFHTHRNISCTK